MVSLDAQPSHQSTATLKAFTDVMAAAPLKAFTDVLIVVPLRRDNCCVTEGLPPWTMLVYPNVLTMVP